MELSEYESAQDYFDRISQQVTAEQAQSLSGVCSFEIEGAGTWNIAFTDSGEVINHGLREDLHPDCTIASREKDWLDVVSGRTKPMSSFVTGKAMKLQQRLL